jgi:hypothetical protein
MSVDPAKSNAAPPSDVGCLAASRSGRHPDPETHADAGAEPADSVELSGASPSLVERSDEAERVPVGTLSPERMRDVLRRLADNVHDSTEARDVIARRVQKDLGLSTTE